MPDQGHSSHPKIPTGGDAAGQKDARVLDYSALPAQSGRSVPMANRTGAGGGSTRANVRIDPSDPFEGNRFKNLYVPAAVLTASVIFTLAGETVFNLDPLRSSVSSILDMLGENAVGIGVELALNVPVMLIASVLSAWLFDVYFGPLFLAVFKLASIAMVQSGSIFGVALIGWGIGTITGSQQLGGLGFGLGILVGALSGLVAYFWLFMYYFDLQLRESLRVAFCIWFIANVMNWINFVSLHRHLSWHSGPLGI